MIPGFSSQDDSSSSSWLLAHLAAIVQSSDDAIVSKSLEGIITSWNPAAERMFGYTSEEAIGGPISMIVPSEQAGEEPEILARIARGEVVDHFETSRMRKDGKRIDVSLTISPVRDATGRVIGALKIARDITERKAVMEQIHLEQERFQTMLGSIGDAVIVTDMRGYVQFLNPVAEQLTKWKPDEAKGKPVEMVFDLMSETTGRRVESPVNTVMREGTVVGLASRTVLVRRDGARIAIDDRAAPIRNRDGSISGVILVFHDVSGSRGVDDTRAKLSAIVEGSDDAIIGKDLEGRITSWNKGAETIFGYSQREAIGRPITMLIPPDRLGEEADILLRIRRGQRVNHFETVRIAKNRQKVHVSLTISPIYDSEGRVMGASKIARDITEKKTAERALEEAHHQLRAHADQLEAQVAVRTCELKASLEELETFSSGLSHDLKTPLRAIVGFAEALQEDFAQDWPPEARELLERISQTGGRLGRFVDNVLSYARVRSTGIKMERVELDLLVSRVIAEYPHAKQANAEVIIQHPLLAAQAHEGLLTQVVSNFVSNAVKYVVPGLRPRIKIWTEQRGLDIRLWVEDNGIGIAEPDHEKIFQLFTRLVDSAGYEGSGVGLAVVRRALDRMNGRVGVESEKGRGSRFWLELPAAAQPEGKTLETSGASRSATGIGIQAGTQASKDR
jgi:PAS domain S-box-containing protein